jgi:S-adenosyl-L-methionine hydrolase (adenosine-forming)
VQARPIVTFLTDFGWQDPFVGIMKGVLLGICPDASLVDLCHEIPPHDILHASFLLHMTVGAFPVGTIHVAVVDPGVGGARRPILATIDGQYFVGPDNGVLSYWLETAETYQVRRLSVDTFWRHPVSASFHGRDIFAPVAGHLAAGVDRDRFGPVITDPVCLETPRPQADASGRVHGQVMRVDRFGNCLTNIPGHLVDGPPSERGAQVAVRVGGRQIGRFVRTFADVAVGEAGAFVGSAAYVELFCNQGHFAREWQVGLGDPVTLDGAAATSARGPAEAH